MDITNVGTHQNASEELTRMSTTVEGSLPSPRVPGSFPRAFLADKTARLIGDLDMRSLEYVDTYDSNLVCPICYCPLLVPVKLSCDHYFCRTCISQAVSNQPMGARTCPSCRGRIPPEEDILDTPAPKLVADILDNLRVACPLRKRGCDRIIARGNIPEHVRQYCGAVYMSCPLETCKLGIQRRYIEPSCLHQEVQCEACEESMMLKDLNDHRAHDCEALEKTCNDCDAVLRLVGFEDHVNFCPEALVPCSAAVYGCDSKLMRKLIDEHQESCTLRKLAPYLASQKSDLAEQTVNLTAFIKSQQCRLEEYDDTLREIQTQNMRLEKTIQNMQEKVDVLPNQHDQFSTLSAPAAPFQSQAEHLLSLHESLREEVGRIGESVKDLDAKLDTTFLNQSLRTREDTTHINAVLSSIRMQVQWLISSRLSKPNPQGPPDLNQDGSTPSAGPGGGSGGSGMTGRTLSDTPRQVTKL